MRALLIVILFALILLPVRYAIAAGESVTSADKKFLAEVVNALQKNDSTWIASHMVYPVSVTISNQTTIVKSQKEFLPILNRELTESSRAEIIKHSTEPLFKNWKGVMVGDGILWFSDFRREGDESSTYEILAIGGFAFQPKDSLQLTEGP